MTFGLWLDRPGHQDGALGHHAGVLHDSPGNLFEIMQDIPQFAINQHTTRHSPNYLFCCDGYLWADCIRQIGSAKRVLNVSTLVRTNGAIQNQNPFFSPLVQHPFVRFYNFCGRRRRAGGLSGSDGFRLFGRAPTAAAAAAKVENLRWVELQDGHSFRSRFDICFEGFEGWKARGLEGSKA